MTTTGSPQAPTRTTDAIVIGSGLAGLSSAVSLAATGHRVTVLEQYTVVGGSTHAFRRKGKWEWQVGVHHLADCGFHGDMPTILRGLGVGEDQLAFRRMDDDAFERIEFPDLVFETPTDWALYEQRLVDVFPEDRARIRRFLQAVRRVGAAVDRGPSSATVTGLGKAAVRMGPYAPLAGLSLQQVLTLFGINPRMQALIGVSPCGSLNAPPSRLPFAAFCSYYRLLIERGSWFPEGGGQMLASTLLQALEQRGGEVVTGESVERILVEHGRATGVRTADGRTYRAPLVISTVDIKKTYRDLIPEGALPDRDRRRVDGYRMSAAFFNAFLGVEVDIARSYPNRDHFAMPTWNSLDEVSERTTFREGDTAQEWLDRVTPVAPAYVHCSNLKDPNNPRYSPPGSSSLEVMLPIGGDHRLWGTAPARRREHDYRADETYQHVKQALTQTMIDRTTTIFPETAGRIVHQEAATPITQERFTQSTEGSAYGIEFNTRQFAVMRPGPTTSVPGLFLAGASCRPGPTTEGVLLSGVQTVGAILGRDLLSEFRSGRYLIGPDELPHNDPTEWDPLGFARGRSGARATAGAD